jgi:hypothetical protein
MLTVGIANDWNYIFYKRQIDWNKMESACCKDGGGYEETTKCNHQLYTEG